MGQTLQIVKIRNHNMLRDTFINLVHRYSSDENLIEKLWLEIEENYSGKSRHYHNLKHLEAMLTDLSEVRFKDMDDDPMLFALFYHDIIYNPRSSDNEERSAKLASDRLRQLNVPDNKIQKAAQMIIATKTHKSSNDLHTSLLIDADLAVLGKNPEQYDEYSKSVRKEFSIYPDFIYNPGRRKVLQHFLEMERIYKTSHFHNKYEVQARENLKNEILKLG